MALSLGSYGSGRLLLAESVEPGKSRTPEPRWTQVNCSCSGRQCRPWPVTAAPVEHAGHPTHQDHLVADNSREPESGAA